MLHRHRSRSVSVSVLSASNDASVHCRLPRQRTARAGCGATSKRRESDKEEGTQGRGSRRMQRWMARMAALPAALSGAPDDGVLAWVGRPKRSLQVVSVWPFGRLCAAAAMLGRT
eukprot:scaffold37090_cov393-Isochrysis_galbana.AAC.1